jgi:hypothetical protein
MGNQEYLQNLEGSDDEVSLPAKYLTGDTNAEISVEYVQPCNEHGFLTPDSMDDSCPELGELDSEHEKDLKICIARLQTWVDRQNEMKRLSEVQMHTQ